ncbi:CTD small phosphatase protein 2 [Spatholobus suberectus]|nr:CTD small phosphatase protein 2 [Spatholobus suberectus]
MTTVVTLTSTTTTAIISGPRVARGQHDLCCYVDEKLVKDLSKMGCDLKQVVIIDNNPNSFVNQPKNAIPIRPFVDDIFNRKLWKLRSLLMGPITMMI